MSLRGLVALLVLLAVAIGLLLWLGRKPAEPKPGVSDAPLVPAFKEGAVREIDSTCGDNAVGLTRGPSKGWRLTKPVDAEADPRRVHDVVTAIQDARIRKVIVAQGAGGSAFGLDPPACTARLVLADGSPDLTVRLGRGSPVGSERYARTADGRVVFTDGSLYGALARAADSYRERRLFPVEADEITRIVLDRPDARIVLVSEGGGWRLDAPVRDVASESACSALARGVSQMQVTDAGATPIPTNVRSDRRIRVEVTTRGGGLPAAAIVASAGIGGKRVAFREGATSAGVIEESAATELERAPDTYRDTHIASFSLPDVRAIAIERGGATLRLERKAEGSPWTGLDGGTSFQVDPTRVEALLEKLRWLDAAGFTTSSQGNPATGTIAVLGASGDLARVSWGPAAPTGDSKVESVWVTTPKRPGVVFRVPASGFGPIPARAADLAPAPPPSPAPKATGMP